MNLKNQYNQNFNDLVSLRNNQAHLSNVILCKKFKIVWLTIRSELQSHQRRINKINYKDIKQRYLVNILTGMIEKIIL
jgi:hypothetical protein